MILYSSLCLYLADPAIFLASTAFKGPYFLLRTACLFTLETTDISEFPVLKFWAWTSSTKLHRASKRGTYQISRTSEICGYFQGFNFSLRCWDDIIICNEKKNSITFKQIEAFWLEVFSFGPLKPLTGEVNNIVLLITWVLAFMWMPLDTHHPSKHCCGPSTTTLPNGDGPPARQCVLQHRKHCSGTAQGTQ